MAKHRNVLYMRCVGCCIQLRPRLLLTLLFIVSVALSVPDGNAFSRTCLLAHELESASREKQPLLH